VILLPSLLSIRGGKRFNKSSIIKVSKIKMLIIPRTPSVELLLVIAQDLNNFICAHGVLISIFTIVTCSLRGKARRKCWRKFPFLLLSLQFLSLEVHF